ncbi:hypothetical protein CHS0354_022207 [Potamilus streckersoni]|uniref:C2H2-type domain-containing protein n=1 Tax=Potamilus streckersoni TaxID=2493646 RepID=A0AAE0T2B3_9BIVA|nr:hypothetical protein CHS0354_022207 [Potamilus streckersoni]
MGRNSLPRKSSHPVCKTRRIVPTPSHHTEEDDEEVLETPSSPNGHNISGNSEVSNELHSSSCPDQDEIISSGTKTPNVSALSESGLLSPPGSDTGSQIAIPPDLFKDFEALRSKTKMDATELMRKLLKDYQSIVTMKVQDKAQDVYISDKTSDEPRTSSPSVTMVTSTLDEEDCQGLDLSVSTRYSDKCQRSVQYMKKPTPDHIIVDDSNEPLDLSFDKICKQNRNDQTELETSDVKVMQIVEKQAHSVPMNVVAVQKNDNCMFVYPVCYTGALFQPAVPSGSNLTGVISTDPTSATTSMIDVTSVMSQNISSVMSFADQGETMAPKISTKTFNISTHYSDLMKSAAAQKYQNASPHVLQNPELAIEKEMAKSLPKYFRMSQTEINSSNSKPSDAEDTKFLPNFLKRKDSKSKSGEMKVVAENTTYPGVYTSVLKLPWSRRTRTKKNKPKPCTPSQSQVPALYSIPETLTIKQEKQETVVNQASCSGQPQLHPGIIKSDNYTSQPTTSESFMMVYPNATLFSLGKPVRKRGRPPKLPMLARLLQQTQKKTKKEHVSELSYPLPVSVQQTLSAQPAQALRQGMFIINPGQVLGALSGTPLQQIPILTDPSQLSEQGQKQSQSQCQPIQGPIQLQPQLAAGQLQILTAEQIQALGLQGQMAIVGHSPIIQGQGNAISQGHEQITDGNECSKTSYPNSITLTPIQPIFVPAASIITTQTSSSNSRPTSTAEINVKHSTSMDLPSLSDDTCHVMAHADTNTISTMNTTCIANTGSGALYQEMILSSKSLVDIKPRKRQTANQLLKQKSSDQNFICTSFRIRPRMVAQAQAQRERLAAKCMKHMMEAQEMDPNQKNVKAPQNDVCHFGENNVTDTVSESKKEDVFSSLSSCNYRTQDISDQMETFEELEKDLRNEPALTLTDPDSCRSSDQDMIANIKHEPQDEEESGEEYLNRKTNSHNYNGLLSVGSSYDEMMSQEMFQELYHCKVCNDIVPMEKKFEHWRNHLPKNFACKSCGCENHSFLVKDGAGNLCPKQKLHCDNCFQQFGKLDGETTSSLPMEPRKIFCHDCGEAFQNFTNLYEHRTVYHKDNKTGDYMCEFCDKAYETPKGLAIHRRTHKRMKISCFIEECSEKFSNGAELDKHISDVHGDGKQYFHCMYERCGKRFIKNFHLQEHIRVKHFNIRAFRCNWPGCEKEFAAERHLNVHLLIHKDEKPLKCSYCDYRCRQRSAMNWHMRKHPELPYKYTRNNRDYL